jgi:hypothetical protein
VLVTSAVPHGSRAYPSSTLLYTKFPIRPERLLLLAIDYQLP